MKRFLVMNEGGLLPSLDIWVYLKDESSVTALWVGSIEGLFKTPPPSDPPTKAKKNLLGGGVA